MGNNTSSRFRRYLQNGDEHAALDVFLNSTDLKLNFDPNSSYGESFQHNSALHLASQHGMLSFLRAFLYYQKGNPNYANASGKTCLHLVCQGNDICTPPAEERRISCLRTILEWLMRSEHKKEGIEAKDDEGNTALHYAAASGKEKLVEVLIDFGIPLVVENNCGETPCDVAEKHGFNHIAELIESKVVFSAECDGPPIDTLYQVSENEVANGMRPQDLQEAKDQLLVETSDMLHVPLFTAEVLLRNHEWSRQSLLESWIKNPVECCENAGISPPTSALQFSTSNNGLKVSCERVQEEYQNESLNSPAKSVPLETEVVCEICDFNIPVDAEPVLVPCNHHFCRNCWKQYLTVKIQEGNAHNILCPAYLCHYLVPVDVIEKVVSQDMVKRYLHFDIKAFVETNPKIKWCPYPKCGRAVKLPELEPMPQEVISLTGASPGDVSNSVDCGNGHYFCWECLGEAHSPVNCERWKEWFAKISDIKPQEMKNTYSKTEDAANWLWMATNSKPCPNCKSPIQKNEGCNHMKCMKCKYDYCWVCLEAWKKHGSATGGYFRCNRTDAVQKAEMRTDVLIREAEAHNKHMQELKKFLHYYTKFRNHENCYKFEESFMPNIQQKMRFYSSYFENDASSAVDVQFLEEAMYELLRARRILCGSYVYGFYLEDNGYNKTVFEILQDELETRTDQLSEMIARTYLRDSCAKITQSTNLVKRRRLEFISAVLKGLIPPATPPALRKSRKNRCPGLLGIDNMDDQEQLSQGILASLESLDPNNPWVKDHQGKHTNLLTLCDWPYDDSDNEDNYLTTLAAKHEHSATSETMIDPSMDLLIALEMSKRQIENDLQDIASRIEKSENACNVFSENEEDKFPSSVNVIPKISGNDSTSQENMSNTDGAESSGQAVELVNDIPEDAEETNCDITSTLTSSPSGTEPPICDQAYISNSVELEFFLKTSCDTDNINSDNIDSKDSDCNFKTEKELFVDVQKTGPEETE